MPCDLLTRPSVGECSLSTLARLTPSARAANTWKISLLRDLENRTDKVANEYLAGAMADLTILQQRAWPTPMAGDIEAAEVVLRAIEQRIRLAGARGN